MDDQGLPPITHTYELGCNTAAAFEAYTAGIGTWWDPRCSAAPGTLEDVTIEPEVGGRIYASHTDQGHHEWGQVTRWEPGHLLTHTFTLAQDPAHPSEVQVTFTARDDGGCQVHFSHGGWTSANADARQRFTDWPALLDRFITFADATYR
jgi:hypothetical protein